MPIRISESGYFPLFPSFLHECSSHPSQVGPQVSRSICMINLLNQPRTLDNPGPNKWTMFGEQCSRVNLRGRRRSRPGACEKERQVRVNACNIPGAYWSVVGYYYDFKTVNDIHNQSRSFVTAVACLLSFRWSVGRMVGVLTEQMNHLTLTSRRTWSVGGGGCVVAVLIEQLTDSKHLETHFFRAFKVH